MSTRKSRRQASKRIAPLDMSPAAFRSVGRRAVDDTAKFLASMPKGSVTAGSAPKRIRKLLGTGKLPQRGMAPGPLLRATTKLLFDESLFNGHPRFWGYITSSPAPLGMLGDLIASAVNPNVGAWVLSPVASEIEAQTIRWIAELIGYPTTCGGLLVSGGNMANFIGFLAARKAKATWDIRTGGLRSGPAAMTVYVSQETHTWIHKAVDLFGLGLESIRWIPVDADRRMNVKELEQRIAMDRSAGYLPMLVVGTAGTVGVGAVDPLRDIAAVCRRQEVWFHVDGAYGAPAAALPGISDDLLALSEADSLALDPHKWLYSPLEAGCTLVKNPAHLEDAFSFHPEYYNFKVSEEEPALNYYELGMQNSRGFRALKVWLALRMVGKAGFVQMIRDDISLSRAMFDAVRRQPALEPFAQNLSIATFRYLPQDLRGKGEAAAEYVNDLNRELLNRLQTGGEAFISNAVVDGTYLLRACIVNFRTKLADVKSLPELVVRIGSQVDSELRPASLHA
ncbi:MAG: amino acid decarboxylase [Ignavibacteria bacterium RIFCSPLOWO2_02_FULL_55_14]|nr:MAG: amino acid decarboxylase [Ignavibacteria bacterium RIFCSPLOWO2_02_FULL_55_14]